MALFVLASLLCGLAPSLPVLIAARLVQGAGAALVTPTSLSLVREAFEDARERARAIALWAVGGSVAAAAGPLLGGVLVQAGTRHGRNIERDPRVAVSVYIWPGPEGGNLGLQITGQATTGGVASGGWQRYTVRPAEVWCFDSRIDHERHRISTR